MKHQQKPSEQIADERRIISDLYFEIEGANDIENDTKLPQIVSIIAAQLNNLNIEIETKAILKYVQEIRSQMRIRINEKKYAKGVMERFNRWPTTARES
jgi:hypothetical protein